jgi:hypothetical protein
LTERADAHLVVQSGRLEIEVQRHDPLARERQELCSIGE